MRQQRSSISFRQTLGNYKNAMKYMFSNKPVLSAMIINGLVYAYYTIGTTISMFFTPYFADYRGLSGVTLGRDEFLQVAKTIQAACPKGTFGFDTSDAKWLVKSMLYQNGNEIVSLSDDGKITPLFAEESGIEVARFWAKMIEEKIMAKNQHDNAENKFLSGKLVFIAATSNRIAKWAESVQFNIAAIEMPYFTKPRVALGGSTATIMTTDPVKHAASWALLKFLLNTENQTAYALTTGYLPIRESSVDLPEVQAYMAESDLYATAIKQLEYSSAYVHFGEMGSMDTHLTYALDDIENGVDPKRAFQEAAENLIADLPD